MKTYALNDNLIVDITDQTTTLANGMAVQEQRGKKDIVHGKVILSSRDDIGVGETVWFPFYSALPMTFDGEQAYVVSYRDLIMVGKAS